MNPQELRIGNLINVKDKISVVDGIRNFNYLYLQYQEQPELLKYAEPIPLTEEWLLKFKASKIKSGRFYYDRFKLIWKKGYNYWYVMDYMSSTYLTKISFVHEWQNFVFAMNSEELTPATTPQVKE